VWKWACPRILENGKRAILVGDLILVFGKEITQQNQRALGCCVSWHFSFDGDCQKLVSTWSHIGFMSPKIATTEDNVKRIHKLLLQTAD
jgi:hypothetical protein